DRRPAGQARRPHGPRPAAGGGDRGRAGVLPAPGRPPRPGGGRGGVRRGPGAGVRRRVVASPSPAERGGSTGYGRAMADIRVELDGGVLLLTVDRPAARNALAAATMAELDALLAALPAREGVRCVVITGAGDRAFISGGDLKELENERSEAFATDLARRMRATLDRIPALPVPVIAAINGAALGGGAEVAIACDFRIAAEDAQIGFTQPLLGLLPAWGGVERLGAVAGRARALYLLTTGRVLSGAE